MTTKAKDPRSFLPLALASGPLHGYGVILAVKQLTDGLIVLRTGTLYILLRRLLDQRLISESNDRPAPDEDDERRRYYALTDLGSQVLEAESRRLAGVVSFAKKKGAWS
jgi:DNA-binding PadR family transcriptional regulator